MNESITAGNYGKNTNKIKIALILTVWVFSMFCGTLSTFIMEASHYFHASLTSAGTLETYQNGAVILFSFIAFSFILKKGYRKSIMTVLLLMIILSLIGPIVNKYWILKIYLVGTGIVLVGMKICIYSSAALVSICCSFKYNSKRDRLYDAGTWRNYRIQNIDYNSIDYSYNNSNSLFKIVTAWKGRVIVITIKKLICSLHYYKPVHMVLMKC